MTNRFIVVDLSQWPDRSYYAHVSHAVVDTQEPSKFAMDPRIGWTVQTGGKGFCEWLALKMNNPEAYQFMTQDTGAEHYRPDLDE